MVEVNGYLYDMNVLFALENSLEMEEAHDPLGKMTLS